MDYTVHVTREGKWWLLEVHELDIVTQARRIADIEEEASDAIAVTLDVPRSQVRVNVVLEDTGTATNIDKRTVHITGLRDDIAHLESELARNQRQLAADLAADEIPVRDIGTILGVSHQRAHQLINTPA